MLLEPPDLTPHRRNRVGSGQRLSLSTLDRSRVWGHRPNQNLGLKGCFRIGAKISSFWTEKQKMRTEDKAFEGRVCAFKQLCSKSAA